MLLCYKSFEYVTKFNNGSVDSSICECKYDKQKRIQIYWQCNCGRKNWDLAPRQKPMVSTWYRFRHTRYLH